ncbi:endonuclease [Bhargavaea massiliensis]|uniref:endonuclease n=1 Tax=Bhargavaea massiliensis TaxID=2697500 RepID=UPI001BCCD5CA|nr:endonuclease [Bhargavaea massiliensis]
MDQKRWRRPLNGLLSASLMLSLMVPAIPATANAETAAEDLLISEYIEGSSFNKALELYNGTGTEVDLGVYTLELYANGSTSPSSSLKLTGTLAPGETYVLAHNQAASDITGKADLLNQTVINFNGDDAVVLKKDGQVIDSFGQVGARANFGTDLTLVRKATVASGDKIADDSFDRTVEWDALGKDDFTNLGTHLQDGSPADPEQPVDTLSIADARALPLGETVTIKGVVAANLKNTISIQDETGGIAVRPTSLGLEVGEEVTLTGTLADYRGLLQLDGATVVSRADAEAPAGKSVTGDQIGEALESQLVTVSGVTLGDMSGGGSWANFTATDGNGEFIVRDETNQLGLEEGMAYESVTGIVQQFDDGYQIIPRGAGDIVADSTILRPASATPGSGTYVGPQEVTLTTTTKDADILYTIDGSDPAENGTVIEGPVTISEDTVLKAVIRNAEGDFSEVSTFEYTITEALQIHDIQGADHFSSFDGQRVEGVEGIVTYHYELNGSHYYHIQTPDELADDNPHTSEAITLYAGRNGWPVQVGDLVSVSGEVSEYAIDGYSDRQETDLPITQINVRDDRGGQVSVVESGLDLPEPVVIDESNLPAETVDDDQLTVFDPESDAIDFWESLEGMRVTVGDLRAVGPQEHGDLVTVLENWPEETIHGGILYKEGDQNAERIQFRLEPNGPARDFEVATGDRFEGPNTGVVGYSYQNYKIFASLDEMKANHVEGDTEPEQTTLVKDGDKLTIASYNLENFSNNKKTTSDDKARKLARAIAVDMQSPDIVGVTEVQDNNGPDAGDSDASESYQRLIDAIVEAGGVRYEYANINPVNDEDGGQPGANIRVGFLYNPERVSLTDGIPHGDATTAVGYEDGKLTLNPGRIAPNDPAFEDSRKPLAAQFDFQGESVVVIANHWNSKGGDTPIFGKIQPPVLGSEAQRIEIAKLVNGFVEDVKADNPDANVVAVGDFNDYQFAEPLKILEGDIMTNMIHHVEAPDRYTYIYQGNSQVLDHIVVSNNLVEDTEIDILHINADFTDMAGRASDHDPLMVQIDLAQGMEFEPIVPEDHYVFDKPDKKKVTIGKQSVSVTINEHGVIPDGLYLNGRYAELHGEGFKNQTVFVKPKNDGTIIDAKGTEVKELIIESAKPLEIRGGENIQSIKFEKKASSEYLTLYDSKGRLIGLPGEEEPAPETNKAPEVSAPLENKAATEGETVSVDLSKHFSDPDGDALTYSATKGNVSGSTLTLDLETGTHLIAVTATDGKASATARFSVTVEQAEQPADPEEPVGPEGYYSGTEGLEGEALKAALHDIISEQEVLSYSEVWEALRLTDEDPNNPDNVILFYSQQSRSKDRNGGMVGDWNREHVWAKSHGDFGTSKGPGTDIHHLRPTDVQVNSSRGNLDFDYGGNPVNNCSGCLRDGDSFEAPDEVKGDVARMLFYMVTRYEEGDRVDLELNEQVNNGSAPFHGKLSVLLEWHEMDPVSEFEQHRNEVIFEIQGNRNPFIDNPEWVESIFGNGAADTKMEQAS